MNRRRAISLLATSSLLGLSACQRSEPIKTFTGFAFGTDINFQLYGVSDHEFATLSNTCVTRLREIESLFNLQDAESMIHYLNRDGEVYDAPEEFVRLIETSLSIGSRTGGLFDITVQPLWDWRQKWKDADVIQRSILEGDAWQQALTLVDYRKVIITLNKVSFATPGMAITLNGIVQGYATEQIRGIFQKSGVKNALIDIGEYAAIGNAPDGKPWIVVISANNQSLELPSGRALAVSSGSGHTFDPEGRFNHIFRPIDGSNPASRKTIVITAPNATLADALSTTLSIASEAERRIILAKFPGVEFFEIDA